MNWNAIEAVSSAIGAKSLDSDETVQYSYIVAAIMSLVYSAYVQYQRSLISDEVWNAYKIDTLKNLEAAGFWRHGQN